LTKYRDNTFCFNDDIQGTGAVILSGFINAVKIVEKDVHPTRHRLLFFGAGSAGVGVAKQLIEFFKMEHGMSEEEAKKLVWLIDTKVCIYIMWLNFSIYTYIYIYIYMYFTCFPYNFFFFI